MDALMAMDVAETATPILQGKAAVVAIKSHSRAGPSRNARIIAIVLVDSVSRIAVDMLLAIPLQRTHFVRIPFCPVGCSEKGRRKIYESWELSWVMESEWNDFSCYVLIAEWPFF
jgi:hypothetical protein